MAGCAKWGMVYGSGDWVDAVSTLKAGDAFVIPKEAVVWFYNEDESNTFSFIGVGETSCGLKPGRITVRSRSALSRNSESGEQQRSGSKVRSRDMNTRDYFSC